MSTALGLWSLIVEPNGDEPTEFSPPADVRITNVALGDTLQDEKGRTSLKMIFPTETDQDSDEEDEEKDDDDDILLSTTVLCSLTPGKIEQVSLDLIIESDNVVLFQIVGKNTLYITGNYISQPMPTDMPPYDEDEDDSDEEDFDLRDVSSDVEMDPAAMDIPSDDEAEQAANLKPVDVEPPKTKKRARESDVTESASAAATVEGEGEKLSKAQKKKLNKKLKADDGAAVPTGVSVSAAPAEAKKEKKEKKEKRADKPAVETRELPGGLKVKDAKVGSGKVAKKGNNVSVRYIGKLENGKIFDQNTKGKPFSFHLGAGEVIKGWDQGVVGMQVGGERLLTVPAPLAYGKRKQGDIPANSTLIFEVKLLDVK